jgi:hypothetical protein
MVLAVFVGSKNTEQNESVALSAPAVAAAAAVAAGAAEGLADAHTAALPAAAVAPPKPRSPDAVGELPNGLGVSPEGSHAVLPPATHGGVVPDGSQGIEIADAAAAAAAGNMTNATVGKGGKANTTAPAMPPAPRQENIFTTLTNKIKSLEINQSLLSRYLEDANERCACLHVLAHTHLPQHARTHARTRTRTHTHR